MLKVESKNIAEVGFNPDQKTLDVVFVNAPNLIYTYYHVGMIKFVKLITADSIGSYFDRNIRSQVIRHPFTRRKAR